MKPKALIKDDFKNILAYQAWVKKTFANLSEKNKPHKYKYSEPYVNQTINRDKNWFGEKTSFELLEAGVTEYQNPELLENLYQKVSHEVDSLISEKLKARKMKFNALGFGMFCFDRASMTLYKVKENERSNQLKVKTNTKELFAYFPEASREKHAVEFFISCDASASVKAYQMLYGGVSAVILAELLIKAGIKVKINIVIGSGTNSSRMKYVGSIITVKNYDEPLDRNVLALLSSDPRFMRFDAFKGVICSFEHFNLATPSGMGVAMNARQLKEVLENSGYTQHLVSKHRFYFGGTFTESEALQKINDTILKIAELINT